MRQHITIPPSGRPHGANTVAVVRPPVSQPVRAGLGLLMVLMALVVMIQYTTSGVLNPHFYLHILNGEWILGHYSLPTTDAFTWTASGTPYMLTQWGAEVILTIAWLLGGGWGTKVVTAAVACGLLYVMHRAANIQFRDVFGSTAVTMLLSGGTLLSLTARPEIFSYLLFSIVVLITEGWRETHRNRPLLWLAPIMILWANLDSAFVVGLLYLSISTIGMGVGCYFKNKQRRDFWKVSPFAIATLTAAIFTLANPYGVGAWDAALSQIQVPHIDGAQVAELGSPTLRDRGGIQLTIVVIMMAAAAGFSRRRLRSEEFMVFSVFLVFGYFAQCNVPYFMMAMIPILSRLGTAADLTEWIRPRFEQRTALATQVLIVIIALPVLLFSGIAIKETGEKAFRKTYSVAALDFLVANRMTDRVMHGCDLGAYFAYSAGMKAFCDHRTQLFDNNFAAAYRSALNGHDGYSDLIKHFDPKAIVIPSSVPLKGLLVASEQFGIVFESSALTILAKRGIGYDSLIAAASGRFAALATR